MRHLHSALCLAATISVAALPTAAIAQPKDQAISPEWFAGTWSDHPDCREPVRFQPDGRFIVTSNGTGALWRLDGNAIILSAPNGQSQRMPIERLDQNRLRATETGVISYRCEGPNNTRSR